ncbi:MAG TPA: alpha/beta family hydrolase [Terriglobia bacterium]|nr:alpha/beta family hydrolase [Terriglobia bacterium]
MKWSANLPERWDGTRAVILAHGAGQGMNSPFMKFFHETLPRRGILSVQFNFEYMETGRKIPDPQPKLQALYRQIVEEVSDTHHPEKLIIGGKSMGGRVASYIAGDSKQVNGLVFLGYPLHPPGKQDQLRDAHLYDIQLPMLFLSGTRDTFATRPLLEQVVDRLGKRATLAWTEGGDHSLKVGKKGTSTLADAAGTIESWLREKVS